MIAPWTGDQADGDTRTSEASSASDTMKIVLGVSITTSVIWKIVVNDERNCLDVNTASEDVGSDQYFGSAGAEGVDDNVALSSIEFAGKASNCMAFFVYTSLNLKSGLTSSHEDDRRSDSHDTV